MIPPYTTLLHRYSTLLHYYSTATPYTLHQKIAHRGDFLFFLHKNLRSSKKKCTFALDFVICITQNTSDNVIFECKNISDNVICYA